MFNHINANPLRELSSETKFGKRFYKISNDIFYPSITSILGAFPNPALMQWRNRVGEEEANKISKQATTRGTKLHSLCETYLLNEEIDKKKYMPDVLSSFYEFKSLLNNINLVYHLEAPLFSNKLKVAGRVDAIGIYKDELSIIDFKTSRKEKREEWIESYFLQATAYALMYYEMTGIFAKNIVILVSVDDGENQEFVKPTKYYIKPLISKIQEYYKLYHI